MKYIAMTGASGFVGTNLTKKLNKVGYSVVAIQREDLEEVNKLSEILEGCEAVINLAGANIIAKWTDSYKKTLYNSRIDTTKTLVEAMKNCEKRPKILISTSAVGIYNNDKVYSEENAIYGGDFLATVCKDWEEQALRAKEFGTRTAIFRFGVVLGNGGGALKKMVTPFKIGFGGTIGSGKQAFSFVHIDDLTDAYLFALENENINGEYNLTAPVPTTNKGLTKALGHTLRRPTYFPVPSFVLKLIYGEGSKVLTDGQSVIPKRLTDAGFEFKYKTIEETIENLLGDK